MQRPIEERERERERGGGGGGGGGGEGGGDGEGEGEGKRNSLVCEVKYFENSDNFELLFISFRCLCTINKNWYAIGEVLEKTQESILDCGDNFPCAHQQIKNVIQSKEDVSDKENDCYSCG